MIEDVTFIIPIRFDSLERLRNLRVVTEYLIGFNAEIIITEGDSVERIRGADLNKNIRQHFTSMPGPFHRTKILNDMIDQCQTKYVCNCDADVILPFEGYFKAVEMLESGYDVVYPYRFGADGERKVNLTEFVAPHRIETHCSQNYFLQDGEGIAMYGKIQFFRTDSYRVGFGENENFISWTSEDFERFSRFEKLGYKIGRIDAPAYHLEHPRGRDSSMSNPYWRPGMDLWKKLEAMNREELIAYYLGQEYVQRRGYGK